MYFPAPLLFNIVPKDQTFEITEEIKVISVGKEEIKLSLFMDDLIAYIKNMK